ncbi:O-antigen ligase family protein [Hymenobacter sp. B81]|uniref:O-antigen ligase family protein n=1 Tax=Hymenobacter sp. B81 TaxID=3344878 RepID=UPI0037DC1286
MKISLRFRFIVAVLAFVVTDTAFTELVFASEDDPRLGLYNYGLSFASLGVAVLLLRYFGPTMRKWCLLTLGCLVLLAFESYAGWGTWMVYPHVFSKLIFLFAIFAVYGFHRRYGLPPYGPLMLVILVGLLSNMLLYHPDALSASAFVDNERGFGSTSTYLLPLLALYYFNQYMTKGGLLRMVLFFALLGFVIFLQHRTVWLSTGLALGVNALLLRRVAGVSFAMPRLIPLAVFPVSVLLIGGLAAFLENPAVLERFQTSIADIQNADKQGTGSWRLKQFQAYVPYMEEYPVAGMRLKGFELPVQFYTGSYTDDVEDSRVWRNGTGHHFHSWYVDRMFYFGTLGVLLVLAVPIGQVVRRLRQATPLDATAAALIAYSASNLLYGVSYDWPVFVYAIMGLTLAAAEPVPAAAPVPALPTREPAPAAAPLTPSSPHAHATA